MTSEVVLKCLLCCVNRCEDELEHDGVKASDDDQVAIKTTVLCCIHTNELDIRDGGTNKKADAAAAAEEQSAESSENYYSTNPTTTTAPQTPRPPPNSPQKSDTKETTK